MGRRCHFIRENNEPCRAAPRLESDFCFWHDPETADEAAEASRLGGLRRRKERTVSGAYELGGLATVADIRRLLEIAVLDTLSLENSVARSRTLAYLAQSALKCLQVGELEERLLTLEAALQGRPQAHLPLFDLDLDPDECMEDES